MLTVMPLCKYIILSAAVFAGSVLLYFWGSSVLAVVLTAGIVWVHFYLSGLKMFISRNSIIKTSGNIFKHKTVILLKNILYVETVTVAPWRPAFIRLRSRGRDVWVIGLDGRQADLVAKAATIE